MGAWGSLSVSVSYGGLGKGGTHSQCLSVLWGIGEGVGQWDIQVSVSVSGCQLSCGGRGVSVSVTVTGSCGVRGGPGGFGSVHARKGV